MVKAQSVEIVGQDDLNSAGEFLRRVKGVLKQVDETMDPIIKMAHGTHKALVQLKNTVTAPALTAESTVKMKMAGYLREQEKIRQEEERRLQEIARKEAEERALQQAAELEAAGMNEEAAAVIEEPVEVPVVVAPKTVAPVAGISTRTVWKFRVTDPDKVPRAYLSVNEVAIGAVVRAMKDKANIPGVEVYAEEVVGARAS